MLLLPPFPHLLRYFHPCLTPCVAQDATWSGLWNFGSISEEDKWQEPKGGPGCCSRLAFHRTLTHNSRTWRSAQDYPEIARKSNFFLASVTTRLTTIAIVFYLTNLEILAETGTRQAHTAHVVTPLHRFRNYEAMNAALISVWKFYSTSTRRCLQDLSKFMSRRREAIHFEDARL